MAAPRLDVFVYGTLKPGESNHHVCASKVIEARPAIVHGQLYALPLGYPVMTLGTDIVHGVVLSFADPGILDILDAYERHDPDEFCLHMPNLLIGQNQYDRTQIKTYDQANQFLGIAWSYVMSLEQVQRLGGILLLDGRWHQPQECYGSIQPSAMRPIEPLH